MRSRDATRSTPAEIARAALKRMAEQGLAPTPAHYRRAYLAESRDAAAEHGALLARLGRLPLARSPTWPELRSAIEDEDWELALDLMAGFTLEQPAPPARPAPALGRVVARFVRQWGRSQAGLSHLQKLQALTTLDNCTDADAALAEMIACTERWAPMRDRPPALPAEEGGATATRTPAETWRRLWTDAVRSAQHGYADAPQIGQQAEALLQDATELDELGAGFLEQSQALWDACDRWHTLSQASRSRLLEVFRLLLDNVAEAFPPEHWMQGQVAAIHDAIAQPLVVDRLEQAVTGLKDLLFRQGVLIKVGDDARALARELIDMVVRSLGAYVENSTRYGDQLEAGLRELAGSEDLEKAKTVVGGILLQSQQMLEDTRQLRASFDEAQTKLQQAQSRARNLESELQAVSELIQLDPLTGALNRRGLEVAFRREIARAQRLDQPLAVAMIDLDHFKRINDTYGHDTGDVVLQELVRIAREHLRPSDVVARMGGEEFLVLLPGEEIDQARQAIGRLQTAFGAKAFPHARLPSGIRAHFSAGLTGASSTEPFDAVYARADQALLRAKAAGRNRIEIEVQD